ncbi:MAG TPA: Rossmann-like and DUF2520 domain-containing protein [Pyrinomonadaceae bacterium]
MKKNISHSKPGITIVGPGRVGMALAIALSRRRYPIETIVGLRLSKTQKSTALLDAQPRVLAAKEIQKLALSEITIIATPDDQIASVADELAKLEGAATVFHTSGALSSDALIKLKERGWQIGSIHPLVSVSDPMSGAEQFSGSYWCVEGSRTAVQVGKSLVKDLAGTSFSIASKKKPLYHAAAVMSAGNIVALFDVAIEMLMNCGLKAGDAKRVLLPLLDSTVANLSRTTSEKALTGTFARGDIATIERHLRVLSGDDLTEALELYRLLGLRSLKLAKQNGLDPKTAKSITEQLISKRK